MLLPKLFAFVFMSFRQLCALQLLSSSFSPRPFFAILCATAHRLYVKTEKTDLSTRKIYFRRNVAFFSLIWFILCISEHQSALENENKMNCLTNVKCIYFSLNWDFFLSIATDFVYKYMYSVDNSLHAENVIKLFITAYEFTIFVVIWNRFRTNYNKKLRLLWFKVTISSKQINHKSYLTRTMPYGDVRGRNDVPFCLDIFWRCRTL